VIREEGAMKEILVSGYSKKEFVKVVSKGKRPGCYLCKRVPGDKGVFIAREEDEENVGTEKLKFGVFEVVVGNKKFKYPLCQECLILVKSLEEKANSSKRLFEMPSLN